MVSLFCYIAPGVSAIKSLCGGKERVTLVVGANEYTISKEVAASASKLAARWMEYDERIGMSESSMRLMVGTSEYLDMEGRQRAEWWKAVLGRVLQSTCSGFWRQMRLASYLGLANKAKERFCRHAVVAVCDAREEVDVEEETMSRLYVDMARELLAQNRGILIECKNEKVRVYSEPCRDTECRYAFKREESGNEGAILCFWHGREAEDVLLRVLRRWVWFVSPVARRMALKTWSMQRLLHRQEVKAELGLKDVARAEIYHDIECRKPGGACQERSASTEGFGLFGADINDESIGMVMRGRIDMLVLRLSEKEQRGMVVQRILGSEEIRRSVKKLRVENAIYMMAKDVPMLEGLERVEEICLGDMVSNECLRALGENRRMAEMLERCKAGDKNGD